MAEGTTQSGLLASLKQSPPPVADPAGSRRGAEAEAKPSRGTKIKEGIKTFLWVAPLTILIWVYAEREQLTTQPEIPLTIRLRTNAPDRVVSLVVPENRQVFVELRGPLNSLDAVRDILSAAHQTLDVTVPDDLIPPYRGQVPIAEWIARNPLLLREAVTASRVRPPVTILVEKKLTVDAPVTVRAEDQTKIGTVEFQPDKVAVEGPQSALQGAKPEVRADMKKVLDLPPGQHTVDVPVEAVGNPLLTVRPSTVKAVVNIRAMEAKTLRQAIPVLVLLNGATLSSDQYRVAIEPKLLADVKVTGSPNAIDELDRLMKDDLEFPAAIVVISPRDLPSPGGEKIITRRPKFRTPNGITVTADREITITITSK